MSMLTGAGQRMQVPVSVFRCAGQRITAFWSAYASAGQRITTPIASKPGVAVKIFSCH